VRIRNVYGKQHTPLISFGDRETFYLLPLSVTSII